MERFDESKIAAFLEKFIATLGVCQRYPPGSQLVKDNLSNLYAQMSELFRETGNLNFSEFHNHLMLNEAALSVPFQRTPLIGAFVFFMLEHNLRTIDFRSNCTQDDLESFLTVLAQDPERLRGDPQSTVLELNVSGIAVLPLGEPGHQVETIEPASSITSIDLLKEAESNSTMESLAEPVREPVPEGPAGQATSHDIFSEEDFAHSDGETRIINRADLIDEEGPTRIMEQPRSSIYDSGARRKILQEEVRPPGTVHLVVMTKMGRQIVDDAKVTILSKPEVEKMTNGQRGASFFLMPGSYKIRVIYDKYIVRHEIQLGADLDEIQMDVNLLDAAT